VARELFSSGRHKCCTYREFYFCSIVANSFQSVEDLEHIDIEENTLVQRLRVHLPSLVKKTIDDMRLDGVITDQIQVSDTTSVLTEEFNFLGLPTVRFWFKEIDLQNSAKPFATNSIAIATEQLNDQLMQGQYGGTRWSLEVEQLAAAEILWGCDDWLPGRSESAKSGGREDKHKLCVTMAFRQFFKDREFLNRIIQDIADGPENYFRRYPESVHEELKLALKDIKHYYKEYKKDDDYWQLARDQWMADNGHWDHWTGKKIVIALGKNKELLHWFFAEAVQSLCPAGTLPRMDKAIKAYAWLNPVQKAGKRFEVNKTFHLRNNPQHDFQRLVQTNAPEMAIHQAVCGAEHMGTHNMQGNMQSILRQEMHLKKKFVDLPGEGYGYTQFEKLQYGAIGIGSKISRFFLELLDPNLFREYTTCTENIPDEFKLVTIRNANGKDCFNYRALNFNTHTEDHLDPGDHDKGIAGLLISGDFTGGDFILRETKQMFQLPPGSQDFVRGPVQRHCTRAWLGDSRFCQVLTVKHSIWNAYSVGGKRMNPTVDTTDPKKRKGGLDDGGGETQAEGKPPPERRVTKTTKAAQAGAGIGSTGVKKVTSAPKASVARGGRSKVKGK
jgi:hypothetical protein